MSNFKYFTSRVLKNETTGASGFVKILVPKDSFKADIDYKCPACGFSEKTKKEWKKPFLMKCAKCGRTIKIASLRSEIKKDRKAPKAA